MFGFRRRQRFENAVRVANFPFAAAELLASAQRRLVNDTVALIQPFAVYTHARSHHQALHRLTHQRFQQHRGPAIVYVGVMIYFVHALTDTDSRRKMIDVRNAG